jgi:hypothetical protein
MKLLDVVATLEDMPGQHLLKGQVGTIVEELDDRHVLVEFANLDGVAYALTPVAVDMLMELRHSPAMAA